MSTRDNIFEKYNPEFKSQFDSIKQNINKIVTMHDNADLVNQITDKNIKHLTSHITYDGQDKGRVYYILTTDYNNIKSKIINIKENYEGIQLVNINWSKIFLFYQGLTTKISALIESLNKDMEVYNNEIEDENDYLKNDQEETIKYNKKYEDLPDTDIKISLLDDLNNIKKEISTAKNTLLILLNKCLNNISLIKEDNFIPNDLSQYIFNSFEILNIYKRIYDLKRQLNGLENIIPIHFQLYIYNKSLLDKYSNEELYYHNIVPDIYNNINDVAYLIPDAIIPEIKNKLLEVDELIENTISSDEYKEKINNCIKNFLDILHILSDNTYEKTHPESLAKKAAFEVFKDLESGIIDISPDIFKNYRSNESDALSWENAKKFMKDSKPIRAAINTFLRPIKFHDKIKQLKSSITKLLENTKTTNNQKIWLKSCENILSNILNKIMTTNIDKIGDRISDAEQKGNNAYNDVLLHNKNILKEFMKCKSKKVASDFSNIILQSKGTNLPSDTDYTKCMNIIKNLIINSSNCNSDDILNKLILFTSTDLDFNIIKEELKKKDDIFTPDNQIFFTNILNIKLLTPNNISLNNNLELGKNMLKMYELSYLYNNYYNKIIQLCNNKSFANINIDTNLLQYINESNIKISELKLSKNNNDDLIKMINNFILLYNEYIDNKVDFLSNNYDINIKKSHDQTKMDSFAVDQIKMTNGYDIINFILFHNQAGFNQKNKDNKIPDTIDDPQNIYSFIISIIMGQLDLIKINYNYTFYFKYQFLRSFYKYIIHKKIKQFIIDKYGPQFYQDILIDIKNFKNMYKYIILNDVKNINININKIHPYEQEYLDIINNENETTSFNFTKYIKNIMNINIGIGPDSVFYDSELSKYNQDYNIFINNLKTEASIYYPQFIELIEPIEKLISDDDLEERDLNDKEEEEEEEENTTNSVISKIQKLNPTDDFEKILKEYIKCKCIKLGSEFSIPNNKPTNADAVKKHYTKYLITIKNIIQKSIKIEPDNILAYIPNQKDSISDIKNKLKNTVDVFSKANVSLFSSLIQKKNISENNVINIDVIEKLVKMYELEILYKNYYDKIQNSTYNENLFTNIPIDYDTIDENADLNNIKLSKNTSNNKKLIKRINNFVKLYKEYINAKIELLFINDENINNILCSNFSSTYTQELKTEYDRNVASDKIYNKYTNYYNLILEKFLKTYSRPVINNDFVKEYLFKYKLLRFFYKYGQHTDLTAKLLSGRGKIKMIVDISNFKKMYGKIITYLIHLPADKKELIESEIFNISKYNKYVDQTLNISDSEEIYDIYIQDLKTNNNIYYPEFIESIPIIESEIKKTLAARP